MQTSRRNFLKTAAVSLAGTNLLSNSLFAAPKTGEIVGIQLYSVRDTMKTDPLGTLKKVATAGYKYVEHANYVARKFYGNSATEFKKILGDLGMKMPSGHTKMDKDHYDTVKKDFTDAWKQTIEDAATVGQEYVISPWLDESQRKTYEDLLHAMEIFNKCGELCKKSGMKFGYHNHDFEFSQKFNNMPIYDIMLKNTDPTLVIQQLDIGNLYNGGATALDVMSRFPGRFQSMHVKDEILSPVNKDEKNPAQHGEKYESTILAKGIVPVKEVIDLGRKSGGTTQFIIEQESYQGKAPIDCMKEDLDQMKAWGY
jgi:sugar phosphate isomerase/epimerase